MLDVLRNHEMALIKIEGEWQVIESSELRRTKEALHRESQFVTTLLDSAKALVVVTGPDGRIVRLNGAASRLVGLSTAEGAQLSFGDLLGGPADLVVAAETGTVFEQWISRDGVERCIDWSFSAMRAESGVIEHVVCTGIDVSERREAERRLRTAYEFEHRIASTLQERLTRPVPRLAGFDVAVAYRPAVEAERVGGDFYDIFQTRDGSLAALIGDVSGKGIEAAGLTETVRSTVRALASIGQAPAFVMTETNRILLEQLEEGRFVTAIFLVLDPRSGKVRHARAGHPPLWHYSDSWLSPESHGGLPLGLFPTTYKEASFYVERGQPILLHTDGLYTRSGDDCFWSENLSRALASLGPAQPEDVVNGLMRRAEEFAGGRIEDDIALVSVSL